MKNDMSTKLAGDSELVLEKLSQGTVATTSRFIGASKISPAIFLGIEQTPCYFLLHLGGGYVEGEVYRNLITLKENAKVIITTQAPTKVYKCEKNKEAAYQQTTIKMEKNSVLEYISDSVILYKNAVYKQDTEIYLDEDSTLIYTDGITSGWSPDGAKFQYEAVQMRNKIFVNNKLILLDNLQLNPRKYNVTELGILEGYINFGTMVALDKRITAIDIENAKKIISELKLDIKFGVSSLEENGFIIRILGNLTQDIQRAIDAVHYHLREKLLGLGPINIRKY